VFFETPVIRGAFLLTPDAREKPDLISHYTLRFKPDASPPTRRETSAPDHAWPEGDATLEWRSELRGRLRR
jgi:hypothetical protein